MTDIFNTLINIKKYGAVGNGNTDNTAYFTNASNEAINSSDGYVGSTTIYLPKGNYRISSNLTIYTSLNFEPGASISVDDGYTLIINGHIIAAHSQYIFDGYGAVLLPKQHYRALLNGLELASLPI